MEEERDNKTGKPVLIIIAVAFMALYNSAVSQMNIQQLRTALNPSFFQVATAVDSSASMNVTTDHNDTCAPPQQNSPMNRVHYVRRTEINYANITTNSTEAICVFDGSFKYSTHFPHAMQQLYVFFNYWNAHPTKKPILILSYGSLRKLGGQRATREFLDMLKSQISLQVSRKRLKKWWEEREQLTKEKPFMVNSSGFDASAYKELNKHMAAHYQLNDTSSDTCSHSKPRIGILNREDKNGRSILNAEQIATVAKELSRDNHIPVAYFETYEFVDQVKFFRSVDVLISPHGAQLTGLAYMDAPYCAHLLEIFPKHYSIPHYFGSLAMSTGKRHSYVYMSEGTFLEEQAKEMRERKTAKTGHLCPSIPTIVGYMQELVADWKTCCASMTTKD